MTTDTIQWQNIDSLTEEVVRLDVNTPEEYEHGHIPAFINFPLSQLKLRLRDIPHYRPIVISGNHPNECSEAKTILTENGYHNIRILEGGNQVWKAQTSPSYKAPV